MTLTRTRIHLCSYTTHHLGQHHQPYGEIRWAHLKIRVTP